MCKYRKEFNMKVKKYLPQIITAVLSAAMLVVVLLSSKINLSTFPFRLFEKLGIYFDNGSYGVMNNIISLNGTHETFVSLLSVSSLLNVFIVFILFSVFLVVALTLISSSATKSSYKWTVYLCAVLLPLVFCDFSNLVYFKTVYSNPLILVLLLLITSAFLHFYYKNSVGIAGLVTVTVLTLIYIGLGVTQAITAIVFGVLIILLSKISKNKYSKIFSVILGIFIILQSVIFTFTYKPYDYKQNLYNSVFYGVAKYDSVTELGLDKKLDDFKEIYYGMKENEAEYDLDNTFYSKISYKDIVKYYITHPANAVKVINNQAVGAFYNDYEFGFTPYSSAKKMYLPMSLVIALAVTAVYILLANIICKKYNSIKPVAQFFAGISIMWFVSLVVTAIYQGNCDVTSNMYTFNVLFDILLVGGLIGGIRIILHRQDEKKSEFGITRE